MSEVEQTLREIRERVRAESQALARRDADATREGNGASVGDTAATPARDEAGEAFARMEANLATAERAHAKLPPLQSNRAGVAARAELWVKRKIKRALHWFTWEQVNFNAAAYHALADALAALKAHDRRLAELQMGLVRLGELHARLEERVAGDAASAERLRAEQTTRVEQLRGELSTRVEQLRGEQAARGEQITRAEQRAEQLRAEQRERVEHLLEEQRVCYRQLSLEASETAVVFDRARRELESRLAEIEKAVTSDEKKSGG